MARFLVALLVLFTAVPAQAIDVCTCHPRELKEEISDAFAIFTGTVKAIRRELNPDRTRVEFDIHAAWRKVKHDEYAVYTQGADLVALAREGFTCGYDFKRGETYLVYAYRSTSEHGAPWVSRCGHTKLLKESASDTALLGTPLYVFDEPQRPEPRDFTPTPLPHIPPVPVPDVVLPGTQPEPVEEVPETDDGGGTTIPQDMLQQLLPEENDAVAR